MLRIVSSELVRVTAAAAAIELGTAVQHLVAKAVADVEQDRVLAGQFGRARSTCAWPKDGARGTTTWNGSS